MEEREKITGKGKESKKGAMGYSIYLTVLCGIVTGFIGWGAKILGAPNPLDYSIYAGILFTILFLATIRFNQN